MGKFSLPICKYKGLRLKVELFSSLLSQDERKKRTFRDYTSQKITLEAVLNTVCKKCGCKGMFLWGCFVLLTQPCSNQIVTMDGIVRMSVVLHFVL